jgi:putative nucleotidyltransferase with HDIG domain
VAAVFVPLVAKGHPVGVLEVFHRSPLAADQAWLDYLDTLAGQAAIAIESGRMFHGLLRSNLDLTTAYDSTIVGWSLAMDLRDKETEGHTLRVTEMTISLAEMAGIPKAEIVHVRRGALLHDIGKMGVPDHILLKPDKLTEAEWEIMRMHPVFAHDMLYPIEYLRPALDIPHYHHEKWDGTGYPDGLKGEEIPLPARLFAVVDVWDAITSDRPYRPAWPRQQAIEHVREGVGSHFDPAAADLFLRFLGLEPVSPD